MGPLMSLCFSDNGDSDNDHGEEWMENPLIYKKILGWYKKMENNKIILTKSWSNH